MIESLNAIGQAWAGFMWDGLLWGSFAAVIAWMIWYGLRNWATPQFGYLLFCLVLLKLVVPIGVPVLPSEVWHPVSSSKVTGVLSEAAKTKSAGEVDGASSVIIGADARGTGVSEEIGAQDRKPVGTARSMSFAGWMLLAWAALAFAGLIRLMWIIRRTRSLIADARPLDPEVLPFSLFDLCERVGVPKVQFVVSDSVTSPAASGFRLPTIILPESLLNSLKPDRLEWTIAHELAHVRRGDLWVALGQSVLQALFFFNPGYWIAHTMLNQLREYSCDDEALQASGLEPKQSAETVFDVLSWSQKPSPMLGMGVSRNTFLIRTRIGRLLDSRRSIETRMSPSAWAALGLAAVLILPRPEAYSTAGRVVSDRFEGLVTVAPTLKEELDRLHSEAEGGQHEKTVTLSREASKLRVVSPVHPDDVSMIHLNLEGFEEGGVVLASIRMGDSSGHGRFQWYRISGDHGGASPEDAAVAPGEPDRLGVLGDLPPGRAQRFFFGFGPGQSFKIAASTSDAVADPEVNDFEVELEAYPSIAEMDPAPILKSVLLTTEESEVEVAGTITAPGEGLQDYQLVVVDASAFTEGGELQVEVILGEGRAAASMDLFPGQFRMPAHPAMQELARRQARLASQYGVAGIKPMESARLNHRFDRAAVFQVAVTGDWMSRIGSQNDFRLHIKVEPNNF